MISTILNRNLEEIKKEIINSLCTQLESLETIEDEYVAIIREGCELPYLNESFTAAKVYDLKFNFYEYEKEKVDIGDGNKVIDILYYNKIFFLK